MPVFVRHVLHWKLGFRNGPFLGRFQKHPAPLRWWALPMHPFKWGLLRRSGVRLRFLFSGLFNPLRSKVLSISFGLYTKAHFLSQKSSYLFKWFCILGHPLGSFSPLGVILLCQCNVTAV